MANLLFVLQFCSTLALVGLIWFVQVVHYPLFGSVGEDRFAEYEAAHQQRTSVVVIPLMLTELTTACAMLAFRPSGAPSWASLLGLILVGVVWGSTFLIQVPAHEKLAGGYHADAHRLLVVSNWIRTVAWTARGALLGWLCLGLISKVHG